MHSECGIRAEDKHKKARWVVVVVPAAVPGEAGGDAKRGGGRSPRCILACGLAATGTDIVNSGSGDSSPAWTKIRNILGEGNAVIRGKVEGSMAVSASAARGEGAGGVWEGCRRGEGSSTAT
jgi:hypothetical protein